MCFKIQGRYQSINELNKLWRPNNWRTPHPATATSMWSKEWWKGMLFQIHMGETWRGPYQFCIDELRESECGKEWLFLKLAAQLHYYLERSIDFIFVLRLISYLELIKFSTLALVCLHIYPHSLLTRLFNHLDSWAKIVKFFLMLFFYWTY